MGEYAAQMARREGSWCVVVVATFAVAVTTHLLSVSPASRMSRPANGDGDEDEDEDGTHTPRE